MDGTESTALEIGALLDALPQSAYVVDRSLRVAAWSRLRETGAQGIPRRAAVGRLLCEVLPAQGFERAVADIDQVLRTGRAHSSKTLVREGDRVFRSHRLPVWQNGSITHVLSLFEDVTAEENAEQLRQALYGIAEATHSSPDMPSLYRSVHAILRDLVHARSLSVVLRDLAADTLSFCYFDDEGRAAPLEVSAEDDRTGKVLRTGEPLCVQESSAPAHAACWLGVPLKDQGATFGVLAVFGHAADAFTERQRELLTFVGRHVATAILRKRAALALALERDLLGRVVEG